jgi:DNA-directed RNA polymerase subunit RPC12/RpoP
MLFVCLYVFALLSGYVLRYVTEPDPKIDFPVVCARCGWKMLRLVRPKNKKKK